LALNDLLELLLSVYRPMIRVGDRFHLIALEQNCTTTALKMQEIYAVLVDECGNFVYNFSKQTKEEERNGV